VSYFARAGPKERPALARKAASRFNLTRSANAGAIGPLGKIGAAAGVAIVHAHAPFFRAYEMAEELCRSAKHLVSGSDPGFAIDWQIGLGRPGEANATVK